MNTSPNIIERIVNIGIHEELSMQEVARVRMTNTVSALSIVLLGLGYFDIFANPHPVTNFANTIIMICHAVVILINQTRNHTVAKVFYLAVFLVSIFVGSDLYGEESHVMLLLVSPVVISFLFFDRNKILIKIATAVLAFILMMLLEHYEYNLIYPNIPNDKLDITRVLFVLIYFFLPFVVLYYMTWVSERMEDQILELLEESELKNQALTTNEEELRQSQEELMAQKELLEATFKEIQTLQQNQISELNSVLEQRMEALNQVAIVREIDVDGKVIEVNDKYVQLSGYARQDILNKPYSDFIVEEHKKALYDGLRYIIKNNTSWHGQMRCKTRLGKDVWLENHFMPFFDANDNLEKIFIIGFDITENKIQQEALAQSKEALAFYDRSLTQFSQISRWDGKQSVEMWGLNLLTNLTDYLDAFQSALYVQNFEEKEEKTLHLVASYNYTIEQDLKEVIKWGQDIIGEAARSNKVIHVEDDTAKSSINIAGKRTEIKAVFILPLSIDGRVEGVLILTSLRPFSKQYTEFLKKISGNIAANIASVRTQKYITSLLDAANKTAERMKAQEQVLLKQNEKISSSNKELQKAQAELKNINENLEKIIAERTQEIELLLNESREANQKLLTSEEELRQNIEELQVTQEALYTQKQLFENQSIFQQTVLNSAESMIITTNLEGVITSVNPMVERTLGYPPHELLHQHTPASFIDRNEIIAYAAELSKELGQHFEPNFEMMVAKSNRGMKNIKEWTSIHKDGTRIVTEVNITAIRNRDGEVMGYLSIANDITERKQKEMLIQYQNESLVASEEELRQNNEELFVVNERLAEEKNRTDEALRQLREAQGQMVQSEKMASLGILTAGVAHEINNPVNFVYNGIDAVEMMWKEIQEVLEIYEKVETSSDAEQAKIIKQIQTLKKQLKFSETIEDFNYMVKDIKEGAARIAEIVKGLRTFSRHDEETLKKANVHEDIDSTLSILKRVISDNEVEVIKEYDEAMPAINGYHGQLNQVFMNIITNAIHASEGNPNRMVRITTHDTPKNVWVRIEDNGSGIPDDVKKRMFEPFFTTKDVGKGTGLGLAISWGIIEKHKGNIEVETEIGKGTIFTITIPKNL